MRSNGVAMKKQRGREIIPRCLAR